MAQPILLPEFSIAGSTAIVTGASRGIGKAIALTLAEAGCDLCLAARNAEALDAVALQVRAMGRKCIAVPTDITKSQQVDAMVQRAIAELSHVDILVNNAGIAVVKPIVPLPGFNPPTAREHPGFFEPTSEAEWSQAMDTNLTGAFYCIRAVGPHMIARGKGKIVSVSSVNALRAGKYRFTYDVSKAGLAQLTRSMAVEWARYKINVNAVGGGYVHTDLTEVNFRDERLKSKILAEIPMRRLASEREIALAVVYLASPAAAYMTGQTVYLDGGLLA